MALKGTPGYLADELPIARFLFLASHFKKGRVRPGAFTPVRREGRLETSIFRIDDLEPPAIEGIATEVGAMGGRTVLARAEISQSDVKRERLFVEFDDLPIQRHGNILGWPAGDDEDDHVAASIGKRQALAIASTLCLHSVTG